MKKEKILISGGAGFIGSHTADALADLGYKIRIMDNLEPVVHRGKWPKYVLRKGYELMRGDVRQKNDWARALRGVSYVFHFAAYQDQRPDFGKFFDVNTKGAALLYELIVEKKLPVKKVVLASTQFVYGDGEYACTHAKRVFRPELRTLAQFESGKFDIRCAHKRPAKFLPFREDQIPNPTNAYGLSKHAMEALSLRFGKTYGIPTVVLRYSIVQGARQSPHNLYSGALRIFVSQALRHQPLTVFEDGKQSRDFVNIDDVVRANLAAFRNPKANFEILNVGGGKPFRVLEFAKLVKTVVCSNSPVVIGGFRRTDTRHAVSSIAKMKKFNWAPKYSPRDSIRAYLLWYMRNYR